MVQQYIDEAARYAELQDKWITSDKDICGGKPIVKGSRVSVHMLAARMEHGESNAILDEDFPHIPLEAREVAVRYAKAHPQPTSSHSKPGRAA